MVSISGRRSFLGSRQGASASVAGRRALLGRSAPIASGPSRVRFQRTGGWRMDWWRGNGR